jgi:hypothetical protein
MPTLARFAFGFTRVALIAASFAACDGTGPHAADAALATDARRAEADVRGPDAALATDARRAEADVRGPDAAVPDARTPEDAVPEPSPAPPLRILFIGNSYTFAGDLEQRYVEVRLADADAEADQSNREVHVARYARPGYRLEQHRADLDAAGSELSALMASHCGGGAPWTFVVLQEQSQIPGFPPDSPEAQASRGAAAALADRARACGAAPVLFETWGRRDGDADNPALFPDYPTMQDRLDEGFAAMAAAGELRRARVGAAFRVLHGRPGFDFGSLYVADGSHPSALGTWLAALVIAGVTPTRDASRPTAGPPGVDPAIVRLLEAVAGEVSASP